MKNVLYKTLSDSEQNYLYKSFFVVQNVLYKYLFLPLSNTT